VAGGAGNTTGRIEAEDELRLEVRRLRESKYHELGLRVVMEISDLGAELSLASTSPFLSPGNFILFFLLISRVETFRAR
jgi:hypothetical protein